MVATMRAESQGAGAHGGCLNRPDAQQDLHQDKVDLVNIVRKAERVDVLKKVGASVCNSSSPAFMDD
jgi:hypothetical protein